jgi:SPP1 gp7 family putative phage head morphogenesis protein
MNVNTALFDAGVSHQIGLIRYSSATVRKILALLGRSEADLVEKIRAQDPTAVGDAWGQKRLDKLLLSLRTIQKEAYSLVGKTLRTDLRALADYEAEFQSRLIQETLPIRFKVIPPTREQLAAAVNSRPFQGALLKEWVRGLEDGAARRVRDSIRIGFVQGESIDDIVKRIRGTKAANFKDGAMEINRRSAEALVRTAVNHVASAARDDLYRQNDKLIKAIQWVSTLDSRTTAICRSLDGRTWKPDDPKRRKPPAHIGCRSTTIPVVKSWRELGIPLDEAPPSVRAAMDGMYPAETTYGDWLRRQPVERQNEILGVTKAVLFRKGGLTMDRFVDDKGHEWTLDELRRREAEAFRKAGLAA